ncbi:MAG: DUF2807 domain-containing protein [Prevotellaceae bacterium]|jgi:hypothetical protein|nr:DUF2807 domain-containing protein [Prevotellaceae bacterium]
MRTVFMSLTVICTTLLCTAPCIAGTVVREDRKTESFSRINAESGIDVYYTQSDSYSVAVEADEDYIGEIITKVENGTLVIKRESRVRTFVRNIFGHAMKVHVSAPALDRVNISGGSDFYAGVMKSDSPFQLKASGGSDVKIADITIAGNADISASGGSDCDITAITVAGNADISASGGSDCNIKNLQAAECKLSASGGSDLNIKMELSGNLEAKASGGSDIKLGGKAGDVSASASGGSDINLRKLECKSVDINKSGGSDVYK